VPTKEPSPKTLALEAATLSAFVPGVGQLEQGRFVAAAVQFGTVLAYLVTAFGLGGRRALLLALVWNAYSVYDAYRHDAG
jgi:hypothetical protein